MADSKTSFRQVIHLLLKRLFQHWPVREETMAERGDARDFSAKTGWKMTVLNKFYTLIRPMPVVTKTTLLRLKSVPDRWRTVDPGSVKGSLQAPPL